MVGEVVASKGVDQIDVAGDVGYGDGDDLAVARRLRACGGAVEQVGPIRREQRGGDQRGHVVTGLGSLDDVGDGRSVANRELVDQIFGFGGHRCSIGAAPDTGLTRGIGRTLRW